MNHADQFEENRTGQRLGQRVRKHLGTCNMDTLKALLGYVITSKEAGAHNMFRFLERDRIQGQIDGALRIQVDSGRPMSKYENSQVEK